MASEGKGGGKSAGIDASEDWALLERWRGGDARAGDALVTHYVGPLSRFFRSKVGDDVDDLVQQSFLACVEGRERIEGTFRAYLFGVARRRLLDRFRRAYRGTAAVDFSVSSLVDFGTSPSQTLARAERAITLSQALSTLPVDWQIALELAYWEDMSGAEIAVVLGIPEATVRSRLVRARSRLKGALELFEHPALAQK